MNCSKCKQSLSGKSSKVIDRSRYCIACATDMFSQSSTDLNKKISNYSDKKLAEYQQEELQKTPRLGRTNYIINIFYIWTLFPLFISFILKDYPDLMMLTIQTIRGGEGIGFYVHPSVLWLVPLVTGMLYTDSRIQDTGSNRWLTLLLGLPIFNFILCLIPGEKENNKFGQIPQPASIFKRTIAPILFLLSVLFIGAMIFLWLQNI